MSVASLNTDSSKMIESNKRRESQPKWKDGFLDSKYECPICNGYLRFPVQFENCQHHTCSSCLPDILRVAPRCPICQQAVTKETIVNDKELQAEIFNLEVFCSKKDNGCQWEGTLKNSLVHIDECQFVTVECQNRCGVKFERRFKEKHEKDDCKNRQVTCEFCQMGMSGEEEVTHLNACEKFPIPCPNRCGVEQIRRGEMKNHLNEVCPKQENSCPFKDCGCDFKGLRPAITQHLKDSPGLHLNLMGKTLVVHKILLDAYEEKFNEQKKSIESLVKTVSNFEKNFGAQYIWKIDQYHERLQEARNNRKTTLFSPPFLTSRHGYRMALSICLCGDGKAKGKYVSLFVCICRGEYDALLTWPFSHRVTFTLLDQCDDVTNRRNITYSVKPNVCKENKPFLGRPVTERNASFGAQKFTDLETLASLQYIRDDTIFIKFELDNEEMILI